MKPDFSSPSGPLLSRQPERVRGAPRWLKQSLGGPRSRVGIHSRRSPPRARPVQLPVLQGRAGESAPFIGTLDSLAHLIHWYTWRKGEETKRPFSRTQRPAKVLPWGLFHRPIGPDQGDGPTSCSRRDAHGLYLPQQEVSRRAEFRSTSCSSSLSRRATRLALSYEANACTYIGTFPRASLANSPLLVAHGHACWASVG